MSNLEIIEVLCSLVNEAMEIVKEQAALLSMHGIETDSGRLEEKRKRLLERVEREGWG